MSAFTRLTRNLADGSGRFVSILNEVANKSNQVSDAIDNIYCATADPFTSDCEEYFLNSVQRVWNNQIDLTLPEKCTVYYSLPQSVVGHMALWLFPDDDDSQGYSIELGFMAIEDDEKKVILFSRKWSADRNLIREKLPVKITASREAMYKKALKAIREFGEYHGTLTNCRTFVFDYCCDIGVRIMDQNPCDHFARFVAGVTSFCAHCMISQFVVLLIFESLRKLRTLDDFVGAAAAVAWLVLYLFYHKFLPGCIGLRDRWDPVRHVDRFLYNDTASPFRDPREIRDYKRRKAAEDGIIVEDVA